MSLYLGSNLISGVFTAHHTTTYDTADATAKETDILSGKTAYVNGSKITGTIPSKTGSDITVSGASFTVPSGYYNSAYTGTLANGTLRTPTYSTTASTGAVTVTYGVSSAGYLAVSSPTWSFTPFTKRNSVVSTYGSTITPSTTAAKTITIPAGYYPTAETLTIAKATGGSQVQTGSISASSSFTISTSFTPKGFMAVAANMYFDGDENLLWMYALNTTTVTGAYEFLDYEVTIDGYTTSILFGSQGWDPPDSTASDYEDAVIYPGTLTSTSPTSVLDRYLYNPASYYLEDSTLTLDDLIFSQAENKIETFYGMEGYTFSGTATYSSTGATITTSGPGYYGTVNYVIWG